MARILEVVHRCDLCEVLEALVEDGPYARQLLTERGVVDVDVCARHASLVDGCEREQSAS